MEVGVGWGVVTNHVQKCHVARIEIRSIGCLFQILNLVKTHIIGCITKKHHYHCNIKHVHIFPVGTISDFAGKWSFTDFWNKKHTSWTTIYHIPETFELYFPARRVLFCCCHRHGFHTCPKWIWLSPPRGWHQQRYHWTRNIQQKWFLKVMSELSHNRANIHWDYVQLLRHTWWACSVACHINNKVSSTLLQKLGFLEITGCEDVSLVIHFKENCLLCRYIQCAALSLLREHTCVVLMCWRG